MVSTCFNSHQVRSYLQPTLRIPRTKFRGFNSHQARFSYQCQHVWCDNFVGRFQLASNAIFSQILIDELNAYNTLFQFASSAIFSPTKTLSGTPNRAMSFSSYQARTPTRLMSRRTSKHSKSFNSHQARSSLQTFENGIYVIYQSFQFASSANSYPTEILDD